MKRFEYMDSNSWNDEYKKSGCKDYNTFLNYIGSKGWEIIPNPVNNNFIYKRELDEPALQRKE